MQALLAILTGKLIAYLSRFLKIGGGSAAPGLYALKIDPELVQKLTRQIPRHVVITGTNGKTTTARMLAHFAKESGLKVIRNHTGSNLERGVASALLEDVKLVHLRGVLRWHLSFDLGIWELDEAAFNIVAPKIKPDIVVFLNVFRDQLDRYGEVDAVVKRWCETLSKMNQSTVLLVNGDDANTAKLKNCFKGKVETFGVKDYKIIGESLAHKVHKHKLDFEAKNIKISGLKGSRFELRIKNYELSINLPVPGIYHIYDAVAAICLAYHLAIPLSRINKSLKDFQPAFGRVEKLPFGYIFLIKNPAGAIQVFETIAPHIRQQDRLLLALNDNLADGTDVSWIWDVNFELLQNSSRAKSRDYHIYVSGSRAADLALRLKYAGFEPEQMKVEPNLEKALKRSREGLKGKLFILPTYTALLELQRILAKQGIKPHYWLDN